MGGSRCTSQFGIEPLQLDASIVPAVTPGPRGHLDASDPNAFSKIGNTPGPLGIRDHADPTLRNLKLIPPLDFEGSVEYQMFEELVLDQHVAKTGRTRSRAAAIPEADLDIVEGA